VTRQLTRRWGVVVGLALVVASNAVVLAGAAWNRSGMPAATLVLTEREATLPWRRVDDDTGLSLGLTLGGADWWDDDFTPWLDRTKLAELGFDVSVAPDDRDAWNFYRGTLPRTVFVALEYDGDAWARWLVRQDERLAEIARRLDAGIEKRADLEAEQERLEDERRSHSHLFAVDAARDAATLRQRYPDRTRYASVRAVVRLHRRDQQGERPARLLGRIERLLVARVHVPLALRPELDAAAAEEQAERRYTATIAFGRRHEPWLIATRRRVAAP